MRDDETNLKRWIEFVQLRGEGNRWREIGWRTSLREAIPEAQRLQRPILL